MSDYDYDSPPPGGQDKKVRLAKRITPAKTPLVTTGKNKTKTVSQSPLVKKGMKTLGDTASSLHNDLFINDYTERSIAVTGDIVKHGEALGKLGGTLNPNLRIGQGWVFSIARKESVELYIQTGEIKPFIFDKKKFQRQSPTGSNTDDTKIILQKLFREFKGAFDHEAEYDGTEIINVINILEKKYLK